MKSTLNFAAVCAVFATAAVASAQYDLTPRNVTIRGGIVLPINDALKSVKNTFMGIGVDYPLEKSLFSKGETYISFDWVAKNLSGKGGQFFPINVNQRFMLNGGAGSTPMYAFAGGGLTVYNFTSSDTKIGGRIGLGFQVSETMNLEGCLFFAEKAKNSSIKSNSIAFYLGWRF